MVGWVAGVATVGAVSMLGGCATYGPCTPSAAEQPALEMSEAEALAASLTAPELRYRRAYAESLVQLHLLSSVPRESGAAAVYRAVLDPQGEILDALMVRSSGMPEFDAAVDTALRRTRRVPVPQGLDPARSRLDLGLHIRAAAAANLESSARLDDRRLMYRYALEWQQAIADAVTADDYPPRALRCGWEGSVVVLAGIDRAGRTGPLEILQSSGRAILDDAALAVVRKAPSVAPPPALSGQAFRIALPVLFRLTR
jgi:TonB family protein